MMMHIFKSVYILYYCYKCIRIRGNGVIHIIYVYMIFIYFSTELIGLPPEQTGYYSPLVNKLKNVN